MKRYRARRFSFDRLTLSSAIALPHPPRRGAARSSRLLPGVATAAGSFAGVLRARRRLRIGLLVALVAAPLAFGGWRWLRTSSLVSVDRVQVTGVHGADAAQITRALSSAAKHMTTLDVNRRALLAAVAPFHVVRSLSVSTSFPHGLRIAVVEQLPVATLDVAGALTAVAADGAVLGPSFVSTRLPTVSGAYQPAPGALVHDPSMRAELEVLGAAPRPLAPLIARAFEGPRGLTVAMRDGLQAYFGDAARAHAKWLALVLVLSDASSAHVATIDVRTPERPAAQFPAGYAPATAASGEGGGSGAGASSESIAAALAAGLASSAGYSSSAEAQSANAAKAAEALSPTRSTTTSESGSSQSGSGSGSESSAHAGGESSGATGGEASAGTGGATQPSGG